MRYLRHVSVVWPPRFPHVPGIDAAGEVIRSKTDSFKPGEKVLVTGFDLGMNTWGGFGGYISIPADWALPLPANMTEKEAMIFGTAGLAAGLSVQQLLLSGVQPDAGKVLVSGASVGVGSIAVAILDKMGYRVTAITGRPDPDHLMIILGAAELMNRNDFTSTFAAEPLAAAKYAGGIDCVGGEVLSGMLKSTMYGGAVTTCGMVALSELKFHRVVSYRSYIKGSYQGIQDRCIIPAKPGYGRYGNGCGLCCG
ncbi:zinc-binding dehydrogenase [Mucilaginibacter daejeonensis]|uniref:zinc-binding dehydrogenase n=1 Tax=Mucilaginibacter daejeonensis TaxID=398049 RepID=UPI001D179E62|nr:zinc-binding dehydrogenase [Mucilaginibacter daejeonensis]UEG51370.1 zinc-binding dehydrogenase [Mucilaginibacter daejeonensis]